MAWARGLLAGLREPRQAHQDASEHNHSTTEIRVVDVDLKDEPAQIGPALRPMLMNESLNPLVTP
jgi:hypothetical protein